MWYAAIGRHRRRRRRRRRPSNGTPRATEDNDGARLYRAMLAPSTIPHLEINAFTVVFAV